MSKAELFRLTYASRSLLAGSSDQLELEVGRILAASRRNNPQVLVTGALLFSPDCFAQTLEGAATAVEEVFERIQRDPRHAETIVLEAGPVGWREFADWSMAYAGRIEHDRLRFDALTGGGAATEAGAERVLHLLRGVVLRAPALV